jgi:riboflavin-specific deaminase-like protein
MRPEVTLCFAQSLDGKIAPATGEPRAISGALGMRFAHEQRAASDAVLVGSGTALADDPALTVRLVEGKSPLRVLLDGRARVPPTSKLFCDGLAPTIHVVRGDAAQPPPREGVERWALGPDDQGQGVALVEVLERLARRGVRKLLVEGGQRVLTSFLSARLVDRVLIAIAPIALGSGGVEAFGDLGLAAVHVAPRFALRDVQRLGDEVILELRPVA